MGIVDGQPVDAANSNPAWIDANADDFTVGKLGVKDPDSATSGPFIINIQREHNATSSYTGLPINSVKTIKPAWTHNEVGTATDDLLTRVDLITFKFNGTSGHAHSGVDGDGTKVNAFNLAAVPLRGYFQQATDLTGVTGTSTDVSTAMAGKTASSGTASTGVVVTTSFNRMILRQSTGANANELFEDASGNEVYGRLTF